MSTTTRHYLAIMETQMCHDTRLSCVISWFGGDGVATIVAAVLAAFVVVFGYWWQQRAARHERRAGIYSEAIRAVEDYLEAPFLVLRREESKPALRELTTHISDVQSRIAYYRAMLQVYAPRNVSVVYGEFVAAARGEAGAAMTAAWSAAPIRRGEDVPLGSRFSRAASDSALDKLISRMR